MSAITSQEKGAPAGAVAFFAQSLPPTGWLVCNGAAVQVMLYPALFSVIGRSYGNGDGVSTFNLPDLRDDFVRGSSGTRAVGTRASDTTRSHTHGVEDAFVGGVTGDVGVVFDGARGSTTRNIQTAATGGAETAPRHVVMLPCIKF